MISYSYYIINAVLLVGPNKIPDEKFCMIFVEDQFIQQYRVITIFKKNIKKNISLDRIKRMTQEITQYSLFSTDEYMGDIVEYIVRRRCSRLLLNPFRIEYSIRNIY